MSRSIALPVRNMDKFLRGMGAPVRRIELEGVAFDHSAPELGIAFEPVAIGFAEFAGKLFQAGIIRELQANISFEQAAALCVIGEAAEATGFEMQHEERSLLPGHAVNLMLAPKADFEGMLGASFEERKALPPASDGFEPFARLFGLEGRVKEKVGGRNKAAH